MSNFASTQVGYHVTLTGNSNGTGSSSHPWDLQTALISEAIKPGDTLWIHEGIYHGRFTSRIEGNAKRKIVVKPYQDQKVVLNGNVKSDKPDVLRVYGGNVVFENLEVTCLGDFSRNEADASFQRINGLIHLAGQDCEFINLRIHNNPGLGVGSWKATGGSIFDGCIVFNNGYIAKNGKGTAEGFYVQNNSNKTRVIKNCTVFNNYYKGIEVWSANKRADKEYVKNITLLNNVVFNNGLPAKKAYDNIIVATNDSNGINVASNIKVHKNILYHNTDFAQNEINGDAPSLTLGFVPNAPVNNVEVKDNIIVGRNNGLRILHANILNFKGNIIHSGYVMQSSSTIKTVQNWTFDNNKYYSKNTTPFFFTKNTRLSAKDWKKNYKLDLNSSWSSNKNFDLPEVLDITPLTNRNKTFRVTVFQREGNTVRIDWKAHKITANSNFEVKNIANDEVLYKGKLVNDSIATIPLDMSNATANNFGVYIVEFENHNKVEKKRKSFFKRVFGWLF